MGKPEMTLLVLLRPSLAGSSSPGSQPGPGGVCVPPSAGGELARGTHGVFCSTGTLAAVHRGAAP